MMYQRNSNIKLSHTAQRSGFTLVEMLVSVALVLMMMSMFAAVLQMATQSVGTQQVISENDQKTRSFVTVIRADIGSRTMRYPFPFHPGESSATSPAFKDKDRDGYVYISTNAPDSGLDDLIQFTVHSGRLEGFANNPDYFGRAALLADRQAIAAGLDPDDARLEGIFVSPNQPEGDDLNLFPNSTGSSPAAEISYFVRNGSLYRRQVLLREPLPIAGRTMETQPTSFRGNDFFEGTVASGPRNHRFQRIVMTSSGPQLNIDNSNIQSENDYWLHFDYAAHAPQGASDPANPLWARVIGTEALSNDAIAAGAANISLGNPRFRWGFNVDSGLSREHTSRGTPLYIGRFLHAETSANNFNWPQGSAHVEGDASVFAGSSASGPTNGNPFDVVHTQVTIDGTNGLVEEFDNDSGNGRGGPRAQEDLLLANVHEFRVEIWDERAGRFVIPGYGNINDANNAVGDYHIRRNLNSNGTVFVYGPLAPYNPDPAASPLKVQRQPHVFDSWHPQVAIGAGISLAQQQAPYMGYVFYPPRQGDSPPGPSSNLMPGEPASNRGYWQPATAYNVGDVVFAVRSIPPIQGWDDNGDGNFEWKGADRIPNQAFQIAYRCVAVEDGDADGSTSSSTVVTEADLPSFAETPGRRFTDNEVIWESFDNRRPLKAVRITVRFMNQKSNEPRQVSLVLPLADT